MGWRQRGGGWEQGGPFVCEGSRQSGACEGGCLRVGGGNSESCIVCGVKLAGLSARALLRGKGLEAVVVVVEVLLLLLLLLLQVVMNQQLHLPLLCV